MKLFVFASSRKVKQHYQSQNTANALLDEVLNISDFLDLVLCTPKRKASDYERLFLMRQASTETEKSKKLFIPDDFFAFLKNNEYLFSFFRELSLENKSIKDLSQKDYYDQYSEHLEILDELLKKYLHKLEQNNLYDEISLPYEYRLNTYFLKGFEELVFDIQGFLSAFEVDILKRCCEIIPVILNFQTSRFNIDFLKKLDFLEDFDLKEYYDYSVSLNEKKVLKCEKIIHKNVQISVKGFDLRSLQCAFVYQQISSFIKEDNIDPKNIIVITPDENFCEFLRFYDRHNMMNYASGVSIKEQEFYQKLSALYEAAVDEDFFYCDEEDYFKSSKAFDKSNTLLRLLKIDFENPEENLGFGSFKAFKECLNKPIDFKTFKDLIQGLLKNSTVTSKAKELRQNIENELLFIENLLKQFKGHDFTLREILELFFIQIQGLKTSFIGGGEVTAMGLLESRGLEFEGVIVVDFNDDLIPKRSVNELFLNNEVRTKSGLISYEQRENLQRFYYESLIKKAKRVAISYVQNEEKSKSRFLNELELKYLEEQKYSKSAYLQALNFDYKENKIDLKPLKPVVEKHDIFEEPLSYSRLNCFLNHKRTYYYKYILKLKELRALNTQDLYARDFGTFIHSCLERYFLRHKKDFDFKEFISMIKCDDDLMLSYQNLSKLEQELFKLRFKEFERVQKEHFAQGFEVSEVEKRFDVQNASVYRCENVTINLIGKIDRIDKDIQGEIFIIDYKSGKIDENSYQLAFYQALCENVLNLSQKTSKAYFFDLKTMKFIEGKKQLIDLDEEFKTILNASKEIEFANFNKIGEEQYDEYCPYSLIYRKHLK